MRREPQLSSDKGNDLKFIVMFTAGFVVVACVVLVGGYAALTVLGSIGQGEANSAAAATPTPTPVPTEDPNVTLAPTPVIYVPVPTPTPTPTPVPVINKLIANLDDVSSSHRYDLDLSLNPVYSPIDMSQTSVEITDGVTTYCNYDYHDAIYALNGKWINANNDTIIEQGETLEFSFQPTGDLQIPSTTQTWFIITLNGEQILNIPIPAEDNNVDTSGGNAQTPYSGGEGGSQNPGSGGAGTAGSPWV